MRLGHISILANGINYNGNRIAIVLRNKFISLFVCGFFTFRLLNINIVTTIVIFLYHGVLHQFIFAKHFLKQRYERFAQESVIRQCIFCYLDFGPQIFARTHGYHICI